jgi:hypothetical protein
VNQQPGDRHLLPVRRAFVVQFSAATSVGQQRFVGRVEHVVSGQAAHFHTLEELLQFMARLLSTHETAPEALPESGGPCTGGCS